MGMPSSTRASRYAQCYWVPGGPRKLTFSLLATKSHVARWAIGLRFRPMASSKSNSSRLCGPEPGSPDPVLAALRVSGGDLALRAGRQVFLVCQGFPAGPLTEAGPPILAGWAAFNVRVGRLALFHLGFGSRPHQGEPPLSQRLRGPHMGRVSDHLVPAQAIDGSATRSPHTRPGPGLVGTSTRRPTTLGCTE
jgi:hypothetical protein